MECLLFCLFWKFLWCIAVEVERLQCIWLRWWGRHLCANKWRRLGCGAAWMLPVPGVFLLTCLRRALVEEEVSSMSSGSGLEVSGTG
jgi:hypothetical protein